MAGLRESLGAALATVAQQNTVTAANASTNGVRGLATLPSPIWTEDDNLYGTAAEESSLEDNYIDQFVRLRAYRRSPATDAVRGHEVVVIVTSPRWTSVRPVTRRRRRGP